MDPGINIPKSEIENPKFTPSQRLIVFKSSSTLLHHHLLNKFIIYCKTLPQNPLKITTFASIFRSVIKYPSQMIRKTLIFSLLFSFLGLTLVGQGEIHVDTAHAVMPANSAPGTEAHADHTTETDAHSDGEHKFNPSATAFHHISDQNVYNIGPFNIPLPCLLYTRGKGGFLQSWDIFSSSKFAFDAVGHGDGHKAYNRYVLHEGQVMRIQDASFPEGEIELSGFSHKMIPDAKGKNVDAAFANYNGNAYQLDKKSTADGGLFGGGVTSFFDFSLGKNAISMLLVCLLLGWMFIRIARAYKNNPGQAPKGIQNLIEPIVIFLRDEVAKPFIGAKWEKFFPFLMSLFFFILGLNLFGQIPFFGGSNVTGNLSVTMVLALVAFILTVINGNKHYWEHIVWMPGVPAWVKIILTPVEILGVFIKPLTLMLRLFANITAGHMTLVVFVSLIFIFGKSGQSVGGSLGASIGSGLLSIFMMAIELLVAFVQAYVFTLLTASYLGAATEEHHTKGEHH